MVIDVPPPWARPFMTRYRFHATYILIAAVVGLQTNSSPIAALRGAEEIRDQSPALWTDRGDIRALDLMGGPGGKEHQPTGKFTFEKEDMNGTSPKFIVR